MPKRKLAPGEDVIDFTGPNSGSVGTSGPSQQHAPQTSPPRAKRLRKDPHKDPQSSGVSLPEKRGAIFKKSCPKNILDRVARVKSQR
jgi:hypothetical protein